MNPTLRQCICSDNLIDASRLFQERRDIAMANGTASLMLLVRYPERAMHNSVLAPEFLWMHTETFKQNAPSLRAEKWQILSTNGQPFMGTGKENPMDLLRNALKKRAKETPDQCSTR